MINFSNLKNDYPHLKFASSNTFVWSSLNQTIYYDESRMDTETGAWSLLHEMGHALLDHTKYRDDLELLMMEVMAWSKAQDLAERYDIEIDEEYVETCVDTYRDWLHKRSRCYKCKTVSLQSDLQTYQCHNCHSQWSVPISKLCRIRKKRIK